MKCIIKKREIDGMEGLVKTHFLNSKAKRINKSLGDAVGLTNIGFHIIEVAPGDESTEYHVHHFEDECLFILAGKATVTIGSVDFEVGEGDFIGCPAGGKPHSMRNTGADTLHCIVVGQRLSHEIVDYPNLGKRLYIHGNDSDLVDNNHITSPVVGEKA